MIQTRENIEKWLLERSRRELSESVRRTGYRNFYFNYINRPDNPLQTWLHLPDGRLLRSSIEWRQDTIPAIIHVYTRRLSQTPFVLHYLLVDARPLKVVDFYEPDQEKILFRLFLFESGHLPAELTISFETQDKDPIAEDSFAGILATGKIQSIKNGYKIHPDHSQAGMFVLAFSVSDSASEPLDIQNDIYPRLTRQDAICRDHNPARKIITGNQTDQDILESLWFGQNVISPAGKIDADHTDLIYLSPWICEFADQSADMSLRDQLAKTVADAISGNKAKIPRSEYVLNRLTGRKIGHITDSKDPFSAVCAILKKPHASYDRMELKELALAAFFTDHVPEKLIIERITDWWNWHKQPVFYLKLHSECVENSEMVLAIALLALRYHLPWAAHLAGAWRGKKQNPLLEMVIHLRQSFALRRTGDGTITAEPGLHWSHNVKGLINSDSGIKIKYTRFGKKIFTQFQYKSEEPLRMDRPVAVIADHSQKIIHLMPVLPGGSIGTQNTVRFQAGEYMLSVPFIWPRFELWFEGIRFRVLAKKDRFQITAFRKGEIKEFIWEGETVRVDQGSRKMFYYYPQDGQLLTGISVLPEGIGRKNVYVSGWAMNRYGVLTDNLHYSYSKQKHAFQADASGGFSIKLSGNREIEHVKIGFRHHDTEIAVPAVTDGEVQKLLAIRPKSAVNRVVLWIDPDSEEKAGELVAEFFSHFSFYPEFIISKNTPDSISVHDVLISCKKMNPKSPLTTPGRFNLNTDNVPKSCNKIIQYIKSCII